MVQEGAKVPDFVLPNERGEPVGLSDFIGRQIILYFYPKDDTPGCTVEACSFRDNWEAIRKKEAVVLGISADSAESHLGFKQKYRVPFPLLSDPDLRVIKQWGVWGEKRRGDTIYEGIMRTTFIIDRQGVLKKIVPNVSPDGHGAEMLKVL